MKTIQFQKTRWWAWAAAALLLGSANIAQADWIGTPTATTGNTTFIGDGADLNDSGIGVTLKTNGITLWNGTSSGFTHAGLFSSTTFNPVVNPPGSPFLSYCVDIGQRTTNASKALIGLATGSDGASGDQWKDQSLNPRSIGAAGWVVNNYANLVLNPGAIFGLINQGEKAAAVALAVWKAAYDWTGATSTDVTTSANNNKLWFTGISSAITTAAQSILVARGSSEEAAYFMRFNVNKDDPNQDQIAPVPIPAALFLVAPALIGVLGGMRRKHGAERGLAMAA